MPGETLSHASVKDRLRTRSGGSSNAFDSGAIAGQSGKIFEKKITNLGALAVDSAVTKLVRPYGEKDASGTVCDGCGNSNCCYSQPSCKHP